MYQQKPVRHSKIANDDLALDIIPSQNLQYFIERILEACQSSNIDDNIDYSNVKEAKIIQRSVENLTTCKQIYQCIYKNICQYLGQ